MGGLLSPGRVFGAVLVFPLVSLSALGVPALQGQGGPPLETDDPGTPGNGRWELNLAGTLEHAAHRTLYEAPLADLNYGIGDRVQLKLEIPFLLARDGRTRTGLGNPLMGMKWRFLEDSSTGSAVSTYPQLELENSLLSPGGEPEESSLLLPLELATVWRGLGINAEAGFRVVRNSPGELIYGLALGLEAASGTELLSECNGWTETNGPGSDLICQLGARREIGEHHSLMAALGTGILGDSDERTRFHMYVGLQSRW